VLFVCHVIVGQSKPLTRQIKLGYDEVKEIKLSGFTIRGTNTAGFGVEGENLDRSL
jgi:hypothetical protein